MNATFDKMKVLAADDNRTNLHILQVFLKKLGHEVILAENGEVAVQRFLADQPDLVLLDIMMPIMDGFEAARQIKALSKERWVPIIFLSALNRDENLVEGLEAGADDYLTKPINFVVLEAKLRSTQRSLAMQQAAINALERLQAISDNVLDAIITTDERGVIASVNRASERIFGWPASELPGKPLTSLLPVDGNDALKNELRQRDGANRAAENEGVALHARGHRFPVTIGVTAVDLEGRQIFVCVVRDISERKQAEIKLRENAAQLQAYFDHNQNEQQLALRLMEKQLHRAGLKDNRVKYKVIATENFSGDVVAAARSPEGKLYAMLADATGHGLSAAISALPILTLFYRMTRQNQPIQEIILEMNRQLKESMPVGRFVAATLVSLDDAQRRGEVWVGGTPEVYLFDRWGRTRQSFPSDNLPLGIVGNESLACEPVTFDWEAESQVMLYSDGLLEATNAAGVQFGGERLLAAAANTAPDIRFQAIDQALAKHLGAESAADDVSIMLIDCA
ncbi:MAG: SpoIIE family protein phosphatase [Azonexus sp.]|nr:SpoIIE family protein phosphatase [Azonexus sp.]